jgi:TatD DNase family protein
MIDTHCHLNFKAFDGLVEAVIERAKKADVWPLVVPGTDVETSKKAVELAEKYPEVYAAVGIHPHHVFEILEKARHRVFSTASPPKGGPPRRLSQKQMSSLFPNKIAAIEELLTHKKVIAVGEVGLDKHYYRQTKYKDYQINAEFLDLQQNLFKEQIKLAIKYKKSLIIHSRKAVGETLSIIGDSSILDPLAGHIVFHCCEANKQLLEFALAHRIYIGVDGDVTYSKEKQKFVKNLPLELLVLETDSPFLTPEPLRSELGPKPLINEPKNVKIIAEKISILKKVSLEEIKKSSEKNTRKLFALKD